MKLKKLNQAPKPEILEVCDNEDFSSWKFKIEEKEDSYIVQKIEGYGGNYKGNLWKNTDSIPKSNSVNVYFSNKTKNIEFDIYSYCSKPIVIIEYENSIGIRKNKKTYVFDTVDGSNLKVSCNGLFGYFEKTEIKYKKLDSFEYNLAQFELDDGRKGYIDFLGNEYYK